MADLQPESASTGAFDGREAAPMWLMCTLFMMGAWSGNDRTRSLGRPVGVRQ
jgi:hypothetical protein